MPELVTFEASRFYRYYCRSHAYASISDARQAVQQVLRMIFAKNGATQLEADRFEVELWDNITADIIEDPAKFLVRLWTSTHNCSILQREWCSCLQEATRLNRKRFAKIVSRIWATMNVFCVTVSRDAETLVQVRDVPWPVDTTPATRHKEWTLFRGGRIDTQHVSWLQDVCNRQCMCRVPAAVAATPDCNTAHFFMKHHSKPRNAWMVRRITLPHAPALTTCAHVQCLRKVSKKKNEIEFLFPPFSAFQYMRVQWVELKKRIGSFARRYC